MSDLQIKLKLLLYPAIIISLCFISGYTFLHWLLVIQLNIFQPSELLITIGLPVVLCWIPTLIWVGPRLRLLLLYADKGNVPIIYIVVFALLLFVPTVLAQQYLISNTGKLTVLQNTDSIALGPLTKYYKINGFYADKKHVLRFNKDLTSRYHNVEYLTMTSYFACPVYLQQDTIQDVDSTKVPAFWWGISYQKKINKPSAQDELLLETDTFLIESKKYFECQNMRTADYFERLTNNESYQGYLAAITNSRQIPANKVLIFENRDGAFKDRTGNNILYAVLSYLLLISVWIGVLMIPKLNRPEADSWLQ